MRIAIDIDSTLHHYWDQFRPIARRLHGVDLPYDTASWHISGLTPEQLRQCIAASHAPDLVLSAEPYPGAVETVARWKDEGHFIHITSHRSTDAHEVTERWLERIELPYDELYCSYDKIARCVEIGIELLIDDSPVNLVRGRDAGILGATIAHPWNREVCEEHGIICEPDWRGLAARLDPVLSARAPHR